MLRSAHQRVYARLRCATGALLIRDLSTLGVWNDPGSAKQRFTLHRAREKNQIPTCAGTTSEYAASPPRNPEKLR